MKENEDRLHYQTGRPIRDTGKGRGSDCGSGSITPLIGDLIIKSAGRSTRKRKREKGWNTKTEGH